MKIVTVTQEILEQPTVFFNLFRGNLAKAAGILEKEYLFGSPEDKIDWEYISKITDYFGYWSEKPKDPLWYLLAHSDKAGIIKVEHVSELIPRLVLIKSELSGAGSHPNWQKGTLEFTNKLKLAESSKEDLIFK